MLNEFSHFVQSLGDYATIQLGQFKEPVKAVVSLQEGAYGTCPDQIFGN
jgi:hypothetical protein